MTITHPQYLFNTQKIYRNLLDVNRISESQPCKLLFIYRNAEQELPIEIKGLLQKLAVACKFKPEDIFYLNYSFQSASFSMIQEQLHPQLVLVFGDISLSRNLTTLNKNVPYELNGIIVLRTESLETLENAKGEKAALWVSLQKMLNLK